MLGSERYSIPIIRIISISVLVPIEVFEEMLGINLVLSYHITSSSGIGIDRKLFSKLVSVMAHNKQDVLDLMNYTCGFKT